MFSCSFFCKSRRRTTLMYDVASVPRPVVRVPPGPTQAIAMLPVQEPPCTSNETASSDDNQNQDLPIQVETDNSDTATIRIDHSLHLPPEILSEIFLESLPHTRLDKYNEYLTQVLRVTHVCGWWRSLGVATPRLWTHLRFIRSNPRELEVARSFIERSGSEPITFLVRIGFLHGMAMDLLAPHSARWQDVNLRLPLNSPLPLSIITPQITDLPLLESLSLSTSQELEFLSVFRIAPKFCNLSIRTMYEAHETWVPWNQLTSLDIGEVAMVSCLQTLEKASNLLTLKIKSLRLVFGHPGPDIPHIGLTFLTTLEIGMTSGVSNPLDVFFDHCTFPSLTNFTLRGIWLMEDTPLKLASMFSRSSTITPLTSLVIDIGIIHGIWDCLAHILWTTPDITDLELRGSDEDPTHKTHLFDILTISDSRCLLPKLQNLTFIPKDSTRKYNELARMIESRRDGERQGTVSQLRSIMYDPRKRPVPASVREYVAEGLLILQK